MYITTGKFSAKQKIDKSTGRLIDRINVGMI